MRNGKEQDFKKLKSIKLKHANKWNPWKVFRIRTELI